MGKPVPGKLFPLCSGNAVVTVGVNGYPAPGQELSPYLDVFRLHQLYQVFHYDVYTVLMKVAVIPEAEQIQL